MNWCTQKPTFGRGTGALLGGQHFLACAANCCQKEMRRRKEEGKEEGKKEGKEEGKEEEEGRGMPVSLQPELFLLHCSWSRQQARPTAVCCVYQ